ncbi:hypothetical protein TKK_0012176 [Trichogramma kaykai]
MQEARGKNMSPRWVLLIGALLLSDEISCMPAIYGQNAASSWRGNVLDDNNVPSFVNARATSSCDPATSRCWQWLPTVVVPYIDDDQNYEQDSDRLQALHVREVDQASNAWPYEEVATATTTTTTTMSPVGAAAAGVARAHRERHAVRPAGSYTKKDVFMSRGWGAAGGMPFSVLYMTPRANHGPNAGGSSPSSSDLAIKASARTSSVIGEPLVAASISRAEQRSPATSNQRLAVRDGQARQLQQQQQQQHQAYDQQSQQSRRHYSIIPQLFISYGWGPSGK